MRLLRKKILLISLALAGLAALALTAAAKENNEGMPGMHAKPDFPGLHLAKELNLSTEQMEKLKAQGLATEKQDIQDEADMKLLHVDLQAEAAKDAPDMDKLEKLTQKMGEEHAKMMLTNIRKMIFFRSLLTPEQKKTLEQINLASGEEKGEKHKSMDMKGKGAGEKDCGCK
jgi:Spy/CpxP family protein refolding chaperone